MSKIMICVLLLFVISHSSNTKKPNNVKKDIFKSIKNLFRPSNEKAAAKLKKEQEKRATEYNKLMTKLDTYQPTKKTNPGCLNKPFYELNHKCKAFTKMIMIVFGRMNYNQIIEMVTNSSIPENPVLKEQDEEIKQLKNGINYDYKKIGELESQLNNVLKVVSEKNAEIERLKRKTKDLTNKLQNQKQDHTVHKDRLTELLWSDNKHKNQIKQLNTDFAKQYVMNKVDTTEQNIEHKNQINQFNTDFAKQYVMTKVDTTEQNINHKNKIEKMNTKKNDQINKLQSENKHLSHQIEINDVAEKNGRLTELLWSDAKKKNQIRDLKEEIVNMERTSGRGPFVDYKINYGDQDDLLNNISIGENTLLEEKYTKLREKYDVMKSKIEDSDAKSTLGSTDSTTSTSGDDLKSDVGVNTKPKPTVADKTTQRKDHKLKNREYLVKKTADLQKKKSNKNKKETKINHKVIDYVNNYDFE